MKPPIFLPVLLLSLTASSQKNDSTGLARGIYLENISVLIPWVLDAANPVNIGYPVEISRTERSIELEWKNVVLFGGLKATTLNCEVIRPEGKARLTHASIYFDSSYSIETIKDHIDRFTGETARKIRMGVFWKKSTGYYHKWKGVGCRISLYAHGGPHILMEKIYLF